MFDAGWSERDLHDAVLTVGLFNLMNRLLEGHGVKGQEALYRDRGAALAREGYAPLLAWLPERWCDQGSGEDRPSRTRGRQRLDDCKVDETVHSRCVLHRRRHTFWPLVAARPATDASSAFVPPRTTVALFPRSEQWVGRSHTGHQKQLVRSDPAVAGLEAGKSTRDLGPGGIAARGRQSVDEPDDG